MAKIERKPIILTSVAGVVYKQDLRAQIGNVSRRIMAHRIDAFLQATFSENNNYREVWNDHYRKTFLPESFVVAFINHIYENKVSIVFE
jgi:hypothetical protein